MQGDVIGLVALDFILRIIRRSTVNVAFIIDGSFMHFDDFSAHTSGFRIPAHVIADFKFSWHDGLSYAPESIATLSYPLSAREPP